MNAPGSESRSESRTLALFVSGAAISNAGSYMQLTAVPFYERLGYVSSGPVFEEAGIDHVRMDYALR